VGVDVGVDVGVGVGVGVVDERREMSHGPG
jgi:hypothetical protein